jgi:hypothetical protein
MKTDALTNPIVRAAIEALQNGNRRPGRRSLSLMLNSMTMGVLVASRSLLAMPSVTSGSLQSTASRTMGWI